MKKLFLSFISIFILISAFAFILVVSLYAATGVDPLGIGLENLSQADDYNNTETTSINTNRRSTIQNQVGSATTDHERTLDDAERNLSDALNNLNQAVSSYRSVNNRFLQ